MQSISSAANGWGMDGLERDTELVNELSRWVGKKPSRIAADLGVAATTLTRPANGKATTRMGRATLSALQAAYPDFPGWKTSAGAEHVGKAALSIIDSTETVQIQKLDLSLSMGPGTLIDDWVEAEPVTFDLAFIRSITRSPSDRLKLVAGIGDSMYPTLNWGDAILVDTTDRHLSKQDGIYWINLYGAAGIKRLRNVGPGRVLVISDNRDVPPQEVDLKDLRIEGRAVWFARGL